MKITKVYVIEYRFWDKINKQWERHMSQEGYFNYSDARKYCEARATNAGRTDMPMYFQNVNYKGVPEEYYIYEVVIK